MAFWVLGGGASGPLDDNGDAQKLWNHHQYHQHHHYHHSDDHSSKAFQSPFNQHHQPSHHHQSAHQYNYDSQLYNATTDSYNSTRPSAPGAPSIHIKNLAFLVIREQHPDSPPPDDPCASFSIATVDDDIQMTSASNGSSINSSFTNAELPPPPRPPPVERTESGHAISDHAAHDQHHDDEDENGEGGPFLDDLAAAQLVRDHVASFHRRCPDSQHGRILRALINPKGDRRQQSGSRSRSRRRRPVVVASSSQDHHRHNSHHRDASPRTTNAAATAASAAFPLDNEALRSVFSAANELFFANRLARRVAWDWSHPGSAQYHSAVVGTTALRRSARLGGWETLIVLSSPVLRDTRYNRRLLLSTFLHEMIHSFLFVTCGRKAGRQGGHTPGFRQIAEVIDAWVGKEYLRLSDMEADLQYFEDGSGSSSVPATPCLRYRQMMPASQQQPPPPQQQQQTGGGGHHLDHVQQQQQQQQQKGVVIPAWQLDDERNVWPPRGSTSASVSGSATGDGLYLNEPVYPPPQQYRHPDDGAWQWYEREGFAARDGPLMGAAQY